MLYQIEEIGEKRKLNYKKVAMVAVIFLLLIAFSIWLGVVAAEKNEEAIQSNLANNQQNNKPNSAILEEEQIAEKSEEEIKKEKEHFYKEVDDIYNGKPGVKRVFLTFDDGPSNTVTPKILDILKENDVKATFFVLGCQVKDHTELVKREYEEGHYIGNHGYTHQYNKVYKDNKSVIKEYNDTEKEIQKALNNSNYSSNLFRFPGGAYGGPYEDIKSITRKEFKKKHIAFLDWNALTYDAEGADSKQEILKNLKETTDGKENIVLLMHDAADKELTYKTLPDVIKYLKDKGYDFQNMYDLMK